MTEQRNDESGAAAAEPAPDWVMQGPKPIELPPLDEAEEQKRRRGERSSSGGWLLLILLLVAALIGTSPYWAVPLATLLPWSPHADTDTLAADNNRQDKRLVTLTQQETQLEQRLAHLEDQARAAAAAAQQQQQQAASLERLAQRVAALEQRPSTTGSDPAEIAALQENLRKLAATAAQNGERLAKLETRDSAGGNEARSDQALLLALGQLRERLQSSQPFAAELTAVEALGRDRPEVRQTLQPLEAAAGKGIPALAVLTHRFQQEVVPAVLHAAQAPQSDDWGDRILARLRGLVVVRRIDDSGAATRDPVDAAVNRAETALGSGDLAGAVAAVESLPDRAAAPARVWLTDARQRLAAEQALAKLTDGVTARLSAGGERSADR